MNLRPILAVPPVLLALLAATASAESFKSWAARGAREEREKDFKAAFSAYSNALTVWKDGDGAAGKARVLCARAALREENGEDEAALKDFSDCLALDKKNAKGFHRRGALLLKGGRTAPAISDFYKAVALDMGFAQAYADRARAYESSGESGFAREDFKRACELGVKAACPQARSLALKSQGKAKPAAAAALAPPEEAAPSAKTSEPEKAGVKPLPRGITGPAPYRPRYKDCLNSLNACVETGSAFGSCVRAAPACEQKAVKGCCPAACRNAYHRAINHDVSEAAAYRANFAANASCGKPPKPKDEEDDDE